MTNQPRNLKLKLNSRKIKALELLKMMQNNQKRNKVKSSTLPTKIVTKKTDIFHAKKIIIIK